MAQCSKLQRKENYYNNTFLWGECSKDVIKLLYTIKQYSPLLSTLNFSPSLWQMRLVLWHNEFTKFVYEVHFRAHCKLQNSFGLCPRKLVHIFPSYPCPETDLVKTSNSIYGSFNSIQVFCLSPGPFVAVQPHRT